MLSRLRITTRDVLRTYNAIAQLVFCKSNRKSSFKNRIFKAITLEKQIQDLIIAKKLEKYILRENNEASFAKTFVCVVLAINITYARLFRLYVVRENANTNCKIWEVARATIATSTFFKRITIVDDEGAQENFLNDKLLFNNLAQLALSKALKIFGDASKLECLISIRIDYPGTIDLS